MGAGPAGCEAALTASKRGHQVTLFEKRGFGGAMVEASRPDNKANIRRLIRYYEEHILADPNITLVKENADFDTLAHGGFDAVILANGGKTRRLQVPGGDSEQVLYASDYLLGNRKAEGTRAVVIGGGITGADTALELLREGKEVTIGEMADAFLASPGSASQAYGIEIAQSPIRILTGKRLIEVQPGQIRLTDRWGNESVLEADCVVVAAGYLPQNELADRLEQETDLEVFHVGDSKKVRQIYDAIHEGFAAARQI